PCGSHGLAGAAEAAPLGAAGGAGVGLGRPRTMPRGNGESGARELGITVGGIVALSRFAPEGFVWPIAVVLLAAVYLGALQIVGEADPAAQSAGVPIESVILPAGAALAALGAIRLVPVGVVLSPALGPAGRQVWRHRLP